MGWVFSWSGRVVAVDHDRLHLFTSSFSFYTFYVSIFVTEFAFCVSFFKVVKLPSRNQRSGRSERWVFYFLEVGRIWTSASFCTENKKGTGGRKCHFSHLFYFTFLVFFFFFFSLVFCVLFYISRNGSVIFLLYFLVPFWI